MKKFIAVLVILLFIIGMVSAQQKDIIIGSWNDNTNERFIHIFLDNGEYIFGYKNSVASYHGKWVLKGNKIIIKGYGIEIDHIDKEETIFELQLIVLNNNVIILKSDNWFGNIFSLERTLTRIQY
jgi:hypothetical protein